MAMFKCAAGKTRNKKQCRNEVNMELPKDPVILLSYINTQLRDFYPSLDELCKSLLVEELTITDKLLSIGYKYNKDLNKFV